jgi:glycosyltransferase involved in cell wall biosynthesis
MKISVCMAVYNGEKYIDLQMRSILHQLKDNDEVIVVNDKSKDRSLEIIHSFNDPRIHVITNSSNQGVVKTFEIAISMASGEIIFLSDQDDIWMPDKVDRIKKVFEGSSEVTLIASNFSMIDSDGNTINESALDIKDLSSIGFIQTIIKNNHPGCTIAVKRDALLKYMPFPSDIAMHDIWILLMNSIYGENLYMEKPLISYRRHDYSVTNNLSYNSLEMITWRMKMIKNVIAYLLSNKISNNSKAK